MSASKSSGSSHSSQRRQEMISEQNCKVYASNIYRDARQEQVRQLFQKFGEITYFALKRKPQDVVYALMQYKTHEHANQAVNKLNRTTFYKRILNVQFGRGGKHQKEHYQTISIIPSKNRDFSNPENPIKKYQQRSERPYLPINKQTSGSRRRNQRSYSSSNQRQQKRGYKKERSKQYNNERYDAGNQQYLLRQDYKRKPYSNNAYSKNQRRDYGYDYAKDQRRGYDEKKSIEENRRYQSKKNQPYGRQNYFRHERFDKSWQQKDKMQIIIKQNPKDQRRYHKRVDGRDQRRQQRRSYDDYQRKRDQYDQQRKQRYGRGPEETRYYRGRQQQARPAYYRQQRDHHQQTKQRDDNRGQRQYKRSRSRQRGPYKQKYQRRQRDYSQQKRRHGKYERQSQRYRSPGRRQQLYKRRHSRSNSSQNKRHQRQNPDKYPKKYFQNSQNQHKRILANEMRLQDKQTFNRRQAQRPKGYDTSDGYRKSSPILSESRQISQDRRRQRLQASDKNYALLKQKSLSQATNSYNNSIQAQNKDY